jgi:hypothetical protein
MLASISAGEFELQQELQKEPLAPVVSQLLQFIRRDYKQP